MVPSNKVNKITQEVEKYQLFMIFILISKSYLFFCYQQAQLKLTTTDFLMNEDIPYKNIKCGIASFTATYISGILHPLDVIKTRFQSHDGKGRKDNLVPKYRGVYHAFREIFAEEGIQGIFKGFHVSILTQALASSIFFWLYQSRKQSYLNKNMSSMTAVSLASIEAAIFASLISQPFWVIKTRMLLNITPKIGQFRNFYDKTKEIHHQYGFKGFLKGLSLNIWLSALSMSQMIFYQGSKIVYDKVNIPQSKYSQKNFVCGGLSKILSALIMYPLTTVRTRIQQNQYLYNSSDEKYKGIIQIIKRTLKHEGIKGFYKGFTPNVMKGIPQKGIYFYFYQLIKERIFHIQTQKKKE